MEFQLPDPLDEPTIEFCDSLEQHCSQLAASDGGSSAHWSRLTSPRQRQTAASSLRLPLGDLHNSNDWTASRDLRAIQSLVQAATLHKDGWTAAGEPDELDVVETHSAADTRSQEDGNDADSEISHEEDLADISALSFDRTEIMSGGSSAPEPEVQNEANELEEQEAEADSKILPLDLCQSGPSPKAAPKRPFAIHRHFRTLLKFAAFLIVFNSLIGQTSRHSELATAPAPIEIVQPEVCPPAVLALSEPIPERAPSLPTRLFQARRQSDSLWLPLALLAAIAFGLYQLLYAFAGQAARAYGRIRHGKGPVKRRTLRSEQVTRVSRLPDLQQVDYKAYLLGDKHVGITTLFHRQLFRTVDKAATEPVTPQSQKFSRGGLVVNLNYCRAPRQNRAGRTYFTNPMCGTDKIAVLVFDLAREETLRTVLTVAEKVLARAESKRCHLFLIGNKSDIAAAPVAKQASDWSASKGIFYQEVSALTGANVDEAFRSFVRHIRAHCARCAL